MSNDRRNLPDGLDELPSGRIRARFRCDGCARHDGKSALHSKSFVGVRDAQKWRTAEKATVHAGSFVDATVGRVTFKSYADEWLARQGFNRSTMQAVELRLRVHAYPALGHLELRAVQPATLQRWLTSLSDLAPSYRSVIAVNVSSVFADAVDNDVLPKNPFDAASVRKSRPKVGVRKVIPWTADQVMAVADALPDHWRVFAILCAGLGPSPGGSVRVVPC